MQYTQNQLNILTSIAALATEYGCTRGVDDLKQCLGVIESFDDVYTFTVNEGSHMMLNMCPTDEQCTELQAELDAEEDGDEYDICDMEEYCDIRNEYEGEMEGLLNELEESFEFET